MAKRILIFSTAYLPLIGGAEIAVKEITERLADLEFVLITARLNSAFPQIEKIGNIEVHRVGKGNAWDKFRLIINGPKYAKKLGKFDSVWSIMASYAGFAALRYKINNSKIPFLLTLQEGDSNAHIYKHVWWCWWYFVKIFKKANFIQVISSSLSNWARSLGAFCPISVVPNGVNLKNFISKNSGNNILNKKRLQERLLLPQDSKIIITVSRLVEKNGVADIIKSLTFLPISAHLVIAGQGPLEKDLRQLVKREELEKRVHFLGEVNHSELAELLWGSDVFCRPSLSEGLGNAFLEAMAAGLPTVGTPVGGIPDFLTEGQTGWFCAPNNPLSIADKIIYIFNKNNSATVELVKAKARQLVVSKFNWDIIAAKMQELLTASLPRLKLLIAADIFPPQSGGPATYSVAIAQELLKQNFQVNIVSLNPESNKKLVDCYLLPVYNLPKLLKYIHYFWLLYKQAKHADVIYAMGPVNAGLPAWLAAKLRGKKLVVKVVGDYAWEQGRGRFGLTESIDDFQNHGSTINAVGRLKKIQCFVVKRANKVIVPSQYLKKIVLGWGAGEAKIKVIYNSVQFKELPPHNKPAGERWIVSVARLVAWKGMDALVEVMPAILETFPLTKLKIIGSGPMAESLNLQVENLGLVNVIDLLGERPHEDALRYIRAADVVVLNSGYEGLSHVILEALSFGRPVVASSAGGNPELIEPGVTGELFTYNNRQELTQKIIKVLLLGIIKKELLLDAERKEFFDKFTLNRMVKDTSEMLITICAN